MDTTIKKLLPHFAIIDEQFTKMHCIDNAWDTLVILNRFPLGATLKEVTKEHHLQKHSVRWKLGLLIRSGVVYASNHIYYIRQERLEKVMAAINQFSKSNHHEGNNNHSQ